MLHLTKGRNQTGNHLQLQQWKQGRAGLMDSAHVCGASFYLTLKVTQGHLFYRRMTQQIGASWLHIFHMKALWNQRLLT